MQRYRVRFFGPIDLIHRDGTHWLKQWWRRKFEHQTTTYIDGIVDDEGTTLWIPHKDAEYLEASGLHVEAVMHPGKGPDGFMRFINIKKEKNIMFIVPV